VDGYYSVEVHLTGVGVRLIPHAHHLHALGPNERQQSTTRYQVNSCVQSTTMSLRGLLTMRYSHFVEQLSSMLLIEWFCVAGHTKMVA
jgi:hypothetical protein